ncbi:DUF6493 family protein [Streptomyces sp. N35]|uniref:DUF6493 family protein n=1 Tax=Streptomyces sp. N35 TaxID=2795730 RepID=UPI0018F6B220|nr:DUF6493 family protein [Streptomyces sp. N35]
MRLLTSGAVDAARAEAGPGVLDVYEAVQQGDAERAAQCVGKLDLVQRRVCMDLLKKLRSANRGVWTWDNRERLRALAVAGAGCQTGAAAASAWIAARDFTWAPAPDALLLDVLAERAPEWLADVAHRLAERPRSADISYELMAGLVRLSGCAAPTTEAYVHGWVFSHFRGRRMSLIDGLRGDPDLTELVAAFFVTPEVGSYAQFTFPGEPGENTWPEALALLTRDGVLDRPTMVASCLARLLRGGRQMDERMFLRLLGELALTREEQLAHLADWTALAADASSPIAAHAQTVLGGLALDGGLSDGRLADVTRAVLFRTEKKLVRAQLVLLGKVLKSRPAAAGELLPAVAEAFGHADTDVQERALKLVGRHTDALDRMQLAELATAAELLTPGLRGGAAEMLGQPIGEEGELPYAYEEFLPPATEWTPVSPAGATPAEVAEDVSVLLAGAPNDLVTFERALDGLMRQAARDRAALTDALRPVVEAQRWWEHIGSWIERQDSFHFLASGIEIVVAAVLGQLRMEVLHRRVQHTSSGASATRGGPAAVRDARCWEAAHRIHSDPSPFLLATPTDSSGALEAAVLVERLEEYTRLGARVGEMDFGQALLRVRFEGPSGIDGAAGAVAPPGPEGPAGDAQLSVLAARADALGTSHGTRLAQHLRGGSLPAPESHREHREIYRARTVLVDLGELPGLQERFGGPLARLGRPVTPAEPDHSPVTHYRHLLAVLPAQPELVAARLLHFMSGVACHNFAPQQGYLAALAEAPGPAGQAVHLSVAYGLAARRPQDRLEAVDALLVLAARGTLDPERLGADIAELAELTLIKPGRFADGLRAGAGTGAYATVWAILRTTLPALLAQESLPAKALGDFLELGADCAERCAARAGIPELTERASRAGTSRVQNQARRLHRALGG